MSEIIIDECGLPDDYTVTPKVKEVAVLQFNLPACNKILRTSLDFNVSPTNESFLVAIFRVKPKPVALHFLTVNNEGELSENSVTV